MTEETKKRMKTIAHFLGEEAKKTVARLLIWLALAVLAFLATDTWERMKAIWHSPATLQEIQSGLRDLSASVHRATGEDRVLRMIPGLSYVSEPVRIGETVILNLVAQRTRLGAGCRMLRGVSLFTDAYGVTLSGSVLTPVRQIGTDQTRLRIEISPPEALRAGRTALHLELEYVCGGETIFDRTEPVVFYLLEAV